MCITRLQTLVAILRSHVLHTVSHPNDDSTPAHRQHCGWCFTLYGDSSLPDHGPDCQFVWSTHCACTCRHYCTWSMLLDSGRQCHSVLDHSRILHNLWHGGLRLCNVVRNLEQSHWRDNVRASDKSKVRTLSKKNFVHWHAAPYAHRGIDRRRHRRDSKLCAYYRYRSWACQCTKFFVLNVLPLT